MNGPTHQLVAGAAVGLFLVDRENKADVATLKPVLGALAAAVLTNLPDVLEPVTSPNHRAFFHSLTFAAAVGVGMHKLHTWQPKTDFDRLLRFLGMVAGSAYLLHLALDFTTSKSLPLIGRA